jgi:uracil-DNA glycosylase family 4
MERGSRPLSTAAAASVLQWWSDAGVDVLVDEEPRDWLRPKPKPEIPPAVPASAAGDDEALPGQLDLFQAYLRDSPHLPFAAPAAPRICPSGDPASGLMILTDMPSGEDCAAGTLLTGEIGHLFDRMLAAIGRDRTSIYLAALSCLRSPTGGFTTDAAKQCATLARHQIGLVAPKALLLFGDACAKALLGLSVAQARGRWHEVAAYGCSVKTIVTIAPRQLLEAPRLKRLAWEDLQMLMEEMKE